MKNLSLLLLAAALAGPLSASGLVQKGAEHTDDALTDLYMSFKSAHQPAPEWLREALFGPQAPVDASREGGDGPGDAVVLDVHQNLIVHSGNSCNQADFFTPDCEDGNGGYTCINAYENTWDVPEIDTVYPNQAQADGNYYMLNSEDWFVFTLPCEGTFFATTCSSNTTYDTCLGLLDSDQNLLMLADDWYNCTNTLRSAMRVTLPAGTYYALVGGYFSACGNYEVTFGFEVDCGSANAEDLPGAFTLEQNWPNPFNPTTTLRFSLSETMDANLSVYDLAGHRVSTLVDGLTERGAHSVSFDASTLSSGLYFYRLEAQGQIQTRKMVLQK